MTGSNPSGTGGPSQIVKLDDFRDGKRLQNVTIVGGGSGGGGPTVDSETKNYLDAKMDSVKAQNEARFSAVLSRLDSLSSKIDLLPKALGFWQLAGMGMTGVVILLTLLGVFADRFDGGISAYGLLDTFAQSQKTRDEGQDAKLDRILGKLDTMTVAPPPGP